MRYCIVKDDDGHKWICPADRKTEVEKNLEEVLDYWAGDHDGDPPQNLTDNLPSFEGEELTFENPMLDGKLIEFST